MLINILCTWEFSGSPLSWAWRSHSGGPGPTPDMEPTSHTAEPEKKENKGREHRQGKPKTNNKANK